MAKRITKKDWAKVEEEVKYELSDRKTSNYRRSHERVWAEVDRQVQMEPLQRVKVDSDEPEDTRDWRSVVELGELTKASEVWSADIRRLTFPENWFEANVELDFPIDPQTGEPFYDKDLQEKEDGSTRALMNQQHLDFGLKNRVESSIKEALHHGSYVATVDWESQILTTDRGRVEQKAAPVWTPYSMWNCYPDPSTSVVGNPFYQGSMLIVSYQPLYKVKRLKGTKEYPYFNLDKIETQEHQVGKDDTEDVEIVTRYGDLTIPRSGEDVFLPNCRIQTANGTLIHYRPNPMPFPEVIYVGYEKLDIRDPYFTSPITKQSPWQTLGSAMSNDLIDSLDAKLRPPIEYNANDYQNIRGLNNRSGPDLAPGAKNAKKGATPTNVLSIGDPTEALNGLRFAIEQIQSGTAVDDPRTGVSAGTEKTATEVITAEKGSELRTIAFVDKHELYGLRTFLYMQHQLNLKFLRNYPYYNKESDSPDFQRASKGDLEDNVEFEVVGSRGMISEARRQQQATNVTAFWMRANPALLKQPELAKEMYLDAGVKSPERFIITPDEQAQREQEIQRIVQTFQAQIAQLTAQIQEFQFQDEEHSLELEQKELEKEQLQTAIKALQGELTGARVINRIEKASGRPN